MTSLARVPRPRLVGGREAGARGEAAGPSGGNAERMSADPVTNGGGKDDIRPNAMKTSVFPNRRRA